MLNKDNRTKHHAFQGIIKRWLLPLVIFVIFLIFILTAPDGTSAWRYQDIVLAVPNILTANAGSELFQDIYGFRALVYGYDPYANLNTAAPLIGARWNDQLPTTHPPTAFLLVAPIAFLPLRVAFAVWAWLMIGAIIVTLRAYGFSWESSIILGLLSMLGPPTITSLGNFPCLWMLGLALAYHQRNRHPFLAGVWIGVASFTKFLPAVMLFPFLVKRKWSALAGFALAWACAIALLLAMSPSVLLRYIESNKIASLSWIAAIGNGSPLVFLFQNYGLTGLGIGLFILLIMFFLNWRLWLSQGEEINADVWHLFALFAVVLLPIAWTYSITPLLPGLLALVWSASPKRLLGILAFASPIIAIFLGLPHAGVILMLLIPYCLNWILPNKFESLLPPTRTLVNIPVR